MDEAALRAMMPSSFGRRAGGGAGKAARGGAAPQAGPAGEAVGEGSNGAGVQSSVLGKRAQREEREEEEEDDGLTAEERAANREAEERERERRERGVASDDDDDDDDSSSSEIGPPAPPSRTASSPYPPSSLPPTTHHASLTNTHTKTVSALAVDSSGSRFALGSYDTLLSLYDFGGMSSALAPFRLFAPWETYPILDLSFNASSTLLLVVGSTAEAKVFTRDGAELGTCKRGDPYLRDMRNTRGHVAGLTCGSFSRTQPATFYTGSSDGTVRIWDVDHMHTGQQDVVALKSKARGGRTKVTALHVDEARLWACGEDGALGMWDVRANLTRPRGLVERAHAVGTWTSAIAVSGESVVTRGGDATVKVWDARALRTPVVERRGLRSGSVHTSVLLDPVGGRGVVTGVADTAARGENDGDASGGSIVVLDRLTLDTVSTTRCASAPIRMHWSTATNQLYTTHRTGLSIFYHPTRSTNGILLPLSRPSPSSTSTLYTSPSTSSHADSYPVGEMGAEPSESAKRRRHAKERQDARATRMPQPPLAGRGRAGRIGAAPTQGLVQSVLGVPADVGDDPREALLRYATREERGEGKDGEEGEEVEYTRA
ncbi:conserved hypothetical protein [Sporisorium reilianum SRZ2]|uniref:Uncharacterized protein n=1 Tax=Sporisorium reilianum (strain SRZ2) TaxID=999809 RepID=E6ZVG8_SPORE|nr:conserved hypothetical protein [Sporisorium reilianum SRZ2]